jgi:bacteriocin-like protein
MMNEPHTIIELSDAELDQVSGGEVGPSVLQEGNGNLNFHSNAPNTPAADRGFNGNGAHIVTPIC